MEDPEAKAPWVRGSQLGVATCEFDFQCGMADASWTDVVALACEGRPVGGFLGQFDM